MFDKKLLEILACPKCKGDLKYSEETESVLCEKCGRVYEIRDGLLILKPQDERERWYHDGKFSS